ncbi:exodeoxyribonuclease VII large subunit [Rhabdothermincola salaria]|uniref:exodeoxyribonuclease VII large subunit n=1 Tax=Rhabdothermincola salaria TaxID=2903142 RepID=UPI001E5E7F7D|nr:exodeoxyribonuclease VII large subunit [Rhabdothermincola salaria]MCD9625447.1 exodeoxyribonuclease VII large subunit [Rhabdothermincola salaria]
MSGRTFTVAELVGEVATVLEERLGGGFWLQGEVAGLTRSRGGHVYFDLVERPADGAAPTAAVPVVLWSSVRDRVNLHLRRAGSIRIEDGVRIRISGRLELYEPKGRLQVQMQGIDPTYTLGLLASERDRVLQVLETEGLLHRNRRMEIPPLPLRVGLVTAAGSAAEADALQTLTDSGLAWRVLHVDARVQGVGAAEQVAAALRTAAAWGVDVVALVRGGGARTDLATFDHEVVARAIATLDVPVVTGIGHETDQSLADLVAHLSERTPTACAAALVAHVRRTHERAEAAWADVALRSFDLLSRSHAAHEHRARRVARSAQALLTLESRHLDRTAEHLGRRAPSAVAAASARVERAAGSIDAASRAHLRTHERHLTGATAVLGRAAPRSVRHTEAALEALAARVVAHDPARALARGWSVTRRADGRVVRRAADLAAGDTVVTTVADGRFRATVDDPPAVPPDPTPRETGPDGR